MLNSKKLFAKILDALKTDYVVDEGTNNGWTYRKWNKGKCEAWKPSADLGNLTPAVWVSPVRYADTNIPMPSIFNIEPGVSMISQSSQWWVVRGDVQSSSIAIRLGTVAPSSQRAIVDCYLFGTWK